MEFHNSDGNYSNRRMSYARYIIGNTQFHVQKAGGNTAHCTKSFSTGNSQLNIYTGLGLRIYWLEIKKVWN